MKRTLVFTLHISAAVLFGIAITLPVVAQDRGEESGIAGRERDFETRSRELRRISEKKPEAARPPQPAELLAQARADFKTLQMVNKDLKQAAAGTDALDVNFVFRSALEVTQRAESLNTILPLPKHDKKAERVKPKPSATGDELKTSVLDLSNLLQGFISNPCFRESSLPENEQTRKAKLDLENIIELSKQLHKDSEKLAKASQNKNP
jgi:hypothetical protein